MIGFKKISYIFSAALPIAVLFFSQPVWAEIIPPAAGDSSAVSHVLSISYEEAVQYCVQSNLDLMAARFDLPMAKADELTAGLWYNPEISFDAGLQPFGRNWHQTNSGGPREFDTAISYPLDLSGKKRKGRQKARIASQEAEASFQDAVRSKILEIRLAYVDAMLEQESLSLSEEKEVNFQRLVDLLQSRIGDKDLLPLLQTRAQLALEQTKLQTRQTRVALNNIKNGLAVLAGFSIEETPLEITTPLRDFKLVELPGEVGFVEEALKARPDVIALNLSLAQAKVERKLARAQRWENISLNMGYSYQGPVGADPSDETSGRVAGANSWGAGVSVPLPLFDRNQGNISKADLAVQKIEKQLAAKELSIRQEIRTLFNELKLNRELIQQYESTQLKNAQTVRDVQQKLFSTGGSVFLEYLDSIDAYHETLSAYHVAVADYRRNIAKLNAAFGKDGVL